jgi:hypothetical protein
MKKSVLLIGGLLLSAMISGAATIQIGAACTEAGAVGNQANGDSFSNISVVCGNFANVNGGVQLGAGYTLLDAFVVFQNDYSLGAGSSATATFTWSNINTNLSGQGSYTDTVTGGFNSSTYTPSGTSVYDPLTGSGCSTTAFNPTSVAGGCATTPSAFLGASSTFVAANVSGTGANLQSNGSIGVAAYVFYDYSTPATGTPEPATLGLCGAALIGLGVIGRKRIRS